MNPLELVSIVGKISKGGSTYPLVIEARNFKGEVDQYVLKLFKGKAISQNYSVAKEILANVIASEFNLSVPDWGIINFNHDELEGFFDSDYISLLDTGYKFCCKYHEGMVIYNPNLNNGFLEQYDMENVFAFDNLILNIDRGGVRNKPNLLINEEDFLLIDHELSLVFYLNTMKIEKLNFQNIFVNYPFDRHVLYKQIKRMKDKSMIFEEFNEYLKSFNLSLIDTTFDHFENFDIENNGKDGCLSYFQWLKNNREFVLKLLRDRSI